MKLDWSIITVDPITKTTKFSINNMTEKVSGFNLLCQKIVKRILTAKGSNVFNNNLGTNFFNLFGTISTKDVQQIKEIIPILIDDLTQQIKTEQIEDILNNVSLTDEEILESIELVSVDFDSTFGGWVITLNIITKAAQATISIP